MTSLKALAKGGMSMAARRKFKKSKPKAKSYKKRGTMKKSKVTVQKLNNNPKTAMAVSGKMAKLPDQRLTRVEFKRGFNDKSALNYPNDGRLLYAGFQNTGGLRPPLFAFCGSTIRDICGKNGVKFPSWTTGIFSGDESYVREATSRERIYKIRFYYRGENEGVSVEEAGSDIMLYPTVGGTVRSLWDLSKDFFTQLKDHAYAGMYPIAYEVHVYRADAGAGAYNTLKFRDSNFGNASVTVRVTSSTNMTNRTENLGGGHFTDTSTTVPLSVRRYQFRNLAPRVSDTIITAADATLNFKNVEQIANTDPLNEEGSLDMQHIINATYNTAAVASGDARGSFASGEGYFLPFKTPPQGKTVFKNMFATSNFTMKPGQTATDKNVYAFSGSVRAFLISIVPVTDTISGSPRVANSSTGNLSGGYTFTSSITSGIQPSGGESTLYAFSRFRTNFDDTAAEVTEANNYPPAVEFAMRHVAECYVQPFKAVPLPVCRVKTNDWTSNPGNTLG